MKRKRGFCKLYLALWYWSVFTILRFCPLLTYPDQSGRCRWVMSLPVMALSSCLFSLSPGPFMGFRLSYLYFFSCINMLLDWKVILWSHRSFRTLVCPLALPEYGINSLMWMFSASADNIKVNFQKLICHFILLWPVCECVCVTRKCLGGAKTDLLWK